MSVTLRRRKNPNGTVTLRLDIYHNGARWVETLKNLKLDKPTTPLNREYNKERLRQGEAIAIARAAELEAGGYGVVSNAEKNTLLIEWMQAYVSAYQKKDKRNMQGALNRFKDYLNDTKKHRVTFANINPLLIENFIDYLEQRSTGEGASSYYNRFKKMIKQSYRQGLMRENPLEKVEKKAHGHAKKKDILTLEEIKILAATHTESPEVRRAFLFSCMSGLRWIDVKALHWSNIRGSQLDMTQSKTGEEIAVPLNETALSLLGEPGRPNELVFDLPTANGANKTLKAWVRRAGIDKKITWHNARHSFGTNLIYMDTDVLTASKLLGHTSMKHTQRYVNAAEEMKQRATDKLNIQI